MEEPIIKEKRGISPIWILPAVALCIGLWLLYKSIIEKPIYIIVHFHSAEGLTKGKTKVMYKGLPVGVVEEIFLDDGLDTVSVKIAMDPKTEDKLVKDVKFWIVRPEIAAGKIRGLETLLTGSYIAVQPGHSNEPCREFQGLDEPPPVPEDAPGLHIKLITESLDSIQKGSPIYFHDIKVGAVQDYSLKEDGTILISAYIDPEFKHMVKPGSRFWNASGISFTGGLNGFKFHMESLTSLINGGIGFYTPDSFKDQPPAKNGQTYKLYRDYEDAQYGIDVVLKIYSGEGMMESLTKVIYHGIEVGRVKKISFNRSDKKYKVTAHLLLNPMVKPLLRKGTKFWIIKPQFGPGGIKNLSTLLTGPYITFVPGEGEPCYEFVVQGDHSKEIFKDGIYYKLVSNDLHSIQPGAPIFFKHIQVGEVARYKLNSDNTVDLLFIIYDEYKHLINRKCVFWNYSGLNFRVTPVTVEISSDTLQAIISGGIAFDYPHKYYKKRLKMAPEGYKFRLYKSFSDAVKHIPELKPKGVFIKFYTKKPISLISGSGIFYKKVKIGEITGIELNSKKDLIEVIGFIEKKYINLINTKSRFFCTSGVEVKGSIRSGLKLKTSSLAEIVMGGISFVNLGHGKKIKEWHAFRLFSDKEEALQAEYVPIDIHFTTMQPIEVNSKVKYKGINIGYVSSIEIDDDLKGITATIKVKKRRASIFTADAKVWVVTPEIGLNGIRNLDTLITGSYLEVEPGKGRVVSSLKGLDNPPSVIQPTTGLNIIVEAKGLGSLKIGCPVYYRQVRVGSIVGFKLSPDAKSVWIYLNIMQPYKKLVRAKSKFWNASGINVDAGIFSGVKIKTETIETILSGGVAFATPEGKKAGGTVSSGHHFKLYEQAEEEWLKW